MGQIGPSRVLVVDDEEDLRNVLRDRLALQGYEVVACDSGEAGLQALRADPYDIVVTDLMMPGISGLDLLREGKEIDPHLVGILMTGQATVATAVEALKTGAFDYIAKPFKLATLRPILDRALELRRLCTENVQLQETLSIYELSNAVSFDLDPETILQRVGEAALKQCSADEASILLRVDGGPELYIAAILGRSSEELLGIRVPPEGVARWVADHQEPVSLHGELNDPRFPGSVYPREMTSASVPMIAAGQLVGVLNVNAGGKARPFTAGQVKALTILASTGASALQNARLYQDIARSERRFRGTFQQSAMGIAHVSPEGRWLRVNAKLCEMLGYPEEELLGLSRETMTHPEDWELKKKLCTELNEGRRSGFQLEQRCFRKSGEMIWTQLTVSAVRAPDGKIEFMVGVLDDITDRKTADIERVETNRRLTQALEDLQMIQSRLLTQERLRALGEMASGIAHDFNNALTPVVGFSELLLDDRSALDRDTLQHHLRIINTAAKDAASVVQRLREFYRPQDESDHFEEVDLDALVQQAVQLTQPKWRDQAQAEGRHIDAEQHLNCVAPIQGDAAQLRELLTNLIFNAVDAMPQGGRMALRTYFDNASVVLEVEDTGIGMSDEVSRRCLEPFFTTKGERGTGLGLPMVFGVVKRHGGRIEVQSEIGRGSTFRVHLPLATDIDSLSDKSKETVPGVVRPLRVLVVDDEPLIRQVTTSYLTVDGHQVEAAESGQDALSKYRPNVFDLVITDQAMPGMSGEQLAGKIRELNPQQPIVLLTGFGKLMQAKGEKPPAIDKVLGKPVTLLELRRAVSGLPASTLRNVELDS